jgi:PEP-CTERM motif
MKLNQPFKIAALFIVVGMSVPAGALAQNLNLAAQVGLYATGTDAIGSPLPGGALDSHYTVAPESASPPYIQAAVLSFDNYWGDWASSTTGKWLYTSDSADDGSRGWYVFRTSFDLTGLDPATVSVSGHWTCDNFGSILLNGMDTGNSLGNDTYQNLYAFTIDSGFQSGVNELDFRVYFPDGYDGLLVSDVSLTAVPEPGSISLLGLAMFGFVVLKRRQLTPN